MHTVPLTLMCTIFEQYFIHTLANVEYLYLNILYFSKHLLLVT